MAYRFVSGVIAAMLLAALTGCSEIEPGSGTRVTITVVGPKPTREQTAELCRYLVRRSADVLNADRARVESVRDGRVFLLLPGMRITAKQADRLLDTASIEFYYLRHVASEREPDRPWRVTVPDVERASYLFAGPGGEMIDSRREPRKVLERVVGAPDEKPILTGEHVLPTARCHSSKEGVIVYVDFDAEGAKIFHEFTKKHRGERLAVFYNGLLVSAPVIKEPVPGGKASIAGFRTLGEAQVAVAQLNAGRLPLDVRIESVEPY